MIAKASTAINSYLEMQQKKREARKGPAPHSFQLGISGEESNRIERLAFEKGDGMINWREPRLQF